MQTKALVGNAALIGDVMSQPPDTIGVLSRAADAKPNDHRSKAKTGAIALAAALLACFMVVLGGEAWRRRPAGG